MLAPKETLTRYLQIERDALLWKVDGLGERELRWPMTPTGTNLLGLVKHVASWAHAHETIDALELESPGRVPWWGPERQQVTLHQILVHVIAETARHAGHADIVRELTDGGVGLRAAVTNMPDRGEQWWADYVDQLRQVAEEAGR